MLKLRFDDTHQKRHAPCTLFFNGVCVGSLVFTKEEAIWFDHILNRGCEALNFNYVTTGKGPDAPLNQIDGCARLLASEAD
jgi:hypothetical protein